MRSFHTKKMAVEERKRFVLHHYVCVSVSDGLLFVLFAIFIASMTLLRLLRLIFEEILLFCF